MDIRKKVQQLIRRHGTNNPERLARTMGINVIYIDLGGSVYGTYLKYKRVKTILIDAERTPEHLRRFVLAHELGHAVCTPDANTSWISAYTLALNTDRIEREANTFAVELLLPDSFIRENEGCSIYQLARLRGVPEGLVELKGIA
ncbi:ImmA/IrrE family metallo-endopeptidase [Selenomonas bovis]|uniref:ImmA/IrrE family metallo-endopeptidase n=1 Tax=Selenomonas bovis TaxID=416586 RepID=A0A848B6X1_9FIRM|nr:ImmA/IrrE family metallo-endopeptidase [Selenomonas bovis]NMD99900.1 ImmA/IrrE family metallo-endopeptidase [Selenomonas bovis]